MSELAVYISKQKLLKTLGKSYRDILEDMYHEGILNGYADVIELRFDKDKALHIQSVLEFYDSSEPDPKPKKG